MITMDRKEDPKNTISNDVVNISVILDSSGSMSHKWKSTIATLSDFLFKQKEAFKNGTYTITHFNDTAEVYLADTKLSNFKGLSPDDIIPDGLTALYSAIIKNCRLLRLRKHGRRKFVVVVTDGQDNRSGEGSQKTAYDIVSEQKKEGVEFFFLGAGIDSFTEANKIGIPYATNISLGDGPGDIGDKMRQLSDNICHLVRTKSTTNDCPELLRAYTEPVSHKKTYDKKQSSHLPPPELLPLTRTYAGVFMDKSVLTLSHDCFVADDKTLPSGPPKFSGTTNSDAFVDIDKQ